jgi:low molecular weight phosphotyrosine protein phosphatase
MREHGTPMSHVARQTMREDFAMFNYILCVDGNKLKDLKGKGNQAEKRES